jgi:hypothetical protein
VAEALIAYETTRKNNALAVNGAIFHRNVERLGLAQDAADRWLRDPDNPEQYDLGPRAEEVTVIYEEFEADGDRIKTVKRRGKLHTLLDGIQERNGIRITGFESKHADPRRLLVDYSDSLRGELQLFAQAWEAWQAKQEEEQQRRQREDEEEQAMAEFMEATLAAHLAGDIAEAFNGLLDAGVRKRVAEYAAPRLLERIIERFRGLEGAE